MWEGPGGSLLYGSKQAGGRDVAKKGRHLVSIPYQTQAMVRQQL